MPFVPELLKEAAILSETAAKALAQDTGALSSATFGAGRELGMGSVFGSRAGRTIAQTEQLYREAPITFAERTGDKFDTTFHTGTINVDNTFEHVIVTSHPDKRQTLELAAYNIHRESPFTNHFPITVQRPDGRLVQERVGRSLDDAFALLDKRFYGHVPPPMPHIDADFQEKLAWTRAIAAYKDASPTFRNLMDRSPVFHDQMEQSVAERLIFGDADGHRGNFALLIRNKSVKVSNLDMESAFDVGTSPHTPKLSEFADDVISPSTIGKIDAFARKFDTSWGRSFLLEQNLSDKQVSAMLARSNWLLDQGRFPLHGFWS